MVPGVAWGFKGLMDLGMLCSGVLRGELYIPVCVWGVLRDSP